MVYLQVCHNAPFLHFCVCDKDHARKEKIGEVQVQMEHLVDGRQIEGWFPIAGSNGKTKDNGELSIKVQFVPVTDNPKLYDVSLHNAYYLDYSNALQWPYAMINIRF